MKKIKMSQGNDPVGCFYENGSHFVNYFKATTVKMNPVLVINSRDYCSQHIFLYNLFPFTTPLFNFPKARANYTTTQEAISFLSKTLQLFMTVGHLWNSSSSLASPWKSRLRLHVMLFTIILSRLCAHLSTRQPRLDSIYIAIQAPESFPQFMVWQLEQFLN